MRAGSEVCCPADSQLLLRALAAKTSTALSYARCCGNTIMEKLHKMLTAGL